MSQSNYEWSNKRINQSNKLFFIKFTDKNYVAKCKILADIMVLLPIHPQWYQNNVSTLEQ